MAESILRDKSKEFAKQIVFLCRDFYVYAQILTATLKNIFFIFYKKAY